MFKRSTLALYRTASYGVFIATLIYCIGFVDDLLIARSMDSPPTADVSESVRVDSIVILLFMLGHGLSTQPACRSWLAGFVPVAARRSSSLLGHSVALILLFAFWQPIGGAVWSLDDPDVVLPLYAFCALGWVLVLLGTAVRAYVGREHGRPLINAGCLFALWATPSMTIAHLVLAIAASLYVLAVSLTFNLARAAPLPVPR